MTTIWRLHIKPEAEKGIDPRQLCLTRGILGIGWPTKSSVHATWRDYCEEAKQQYAEGIVGWRKAANAIGDHMKPGDLCWTRDRSNTYYLGRVTSDWRYEGGEEYRKADVVNVRNCDWHEAGLVDSIPGKVIASFRVSAALQAVRDTTVLWYSMGFYNSKSSGFKYEVDMPSSLDIFSMLQAEDLEDIVGLYLQSLGYRLIPSSCRSDTMQYEFVMKRPGDGRMCVAQVKSGGVDIDVSEYEKHDADVFLFTSGGKYLNSPRPNVTCLQSELIRIFLHNNLEVMPDRIRRMVSTCRAMKGKNI